MSDEEMIAETTAASLTSERAVLSAALYGPASMTAAARLLSDEDFWSPVHADLWRIMRMLHAAGTVAEPRAVYNEAAKLSSEHVRVLVDLGTQGLPFGTVEHHAAVIVRAATIRNLQQTLRRGWQQATSPEAEPVEVAESLIEQLRVTQRMQGAPDTTIDFLDIVGRVVNPADWVIPGLLAKANRIIITAPEGYGKSTLLRQIACCVAVGLHPFKATLAQRPRRVYCLDAENPEDINTEEYRLLYKALEVLDAIPGRGMLTIDERGPFIDLLNPREAASVYQRIEQLQPEMITVGPLYKLFDEDPNLEGPAKKLSGVLDRMRAICGSALITEAHSPHNDAGAPPVLRPYGASLWRRWPEFGYCLHSVVGPEPTQPKAGSPTKEFTAYKEARTEWDAAQAVGASKFTPWRGDRGRNREWPKRLQYGRVLPWVEPGSDFAQPLVA
jgi:hypothetical protein